MRPPQATPTGKFLGTAHLQRLLREPPSALVSGVCREGHRRAASRPAIDEVTRHLATYNLVAAPVVDDHDRLLGAVSVDDVLDHLLPEGWRDADRTAVQWLSDAPASTSPRSSAGRGCAIDAEAFGRLTERIARFLGTGRYLVVQTVVDRSLWMLVEHAIAEVAGSFDPYHRSCS